MAKLLDLIDKYLKPYYLYVLITFVLIIFIIAGYYAYRKYITPAIENDKYKDVSNANRRNKEAVLYFSLPIGVHIVERPNLNGMLSRMNTIRKTNL